METEKISPEINPKPEPLIRHKKQNWSRSLNLNIAENSETTIGFHRGPAQRRKGAVIVAWSWVAAMIDGLLLVGASVLLIVTFVYASKFVISKQLFFLASLVVLCGISFSYMVILRSFLGFSIGEWACGLRLGTTIQRLSSTYSLKVLARVCLVFATGLVLLPALSLILGKDLPGLITGVILISPSK